MSSALELKKIYYCAALFSFTFSLPLYGLDLGEMHDMKVEVAPSNTVVKDQSSSPDFIASIGRLGKKNTPPAEFLNESNALLKQQLSLVKEQNYQLQEQLEKRDKDVELIRQLLQSVGKQTEAIKQTSLVQPEVFSSSWVLRMLFLIFIASGGGYWYLVMGRDKEVIKQAIPRQSANSTASGTTSCALSVEVMTVPSNNTALNLKESLQITIPAVMMSKKEELQSTHSETTTDPLKSKLAFDTLIDLAKTYITIADFDSARQALDEVQEQGTPSQKKEVSDILLQIQHRKN